MKKTICILLILALLPFSMAGCVAQKEAPAVPESAVNAPDNAPVAGEIPFEQYISGSASNATEEDLAKLRVEYDGVQAAHAQGTISDRAFTERMLAFDDALREAGVYIPYKSLAAYTFAIESLSQEDRAFLEANYDNFMAAYSQANSPESLLNIYAQGKEIYKKYHLNLDELISSIQGATYNFAIFKVDGDTVELDPDRNTTFKPIDDAHKKAYLELCAQIREIVPADVWKRVSSFSVFASSGASAFAQFETLERKTFRIGIDVTSMLDQTGHLAREQRQVIVHETAHIITQNDTQVSSKPPESVYASETEAFLDQYQKDSYLYQFFTKFWSDIYDEYLKSTDPSAFYSKYQDQFVSDYAAMVPEEDIAESFRVFVLSDQPTSDSIRDQKVRFFYDYKEFVAWREEIRNALSK